VNNTALFYHQVVTVRDLATSRSTCVRKLSVKGLSYRNRNSILTEYKNYWNFRCVKFHMAVCVRKHSSIISVCIVDIICFPIFSIFGTVFKMLVIGNFVCNEKLYKINKNDFKNITIFLVRFDLLMSSLMTFSYHQN